MLLLAMPIGVASADEGNPRVNQLGYRSDGAKIASLRTAQRTPQRWELRQGNQRIAHGLTAYARVDAASGDMLQRIDFSAVRATGSGFTLHVGAHQSYPFALKHDVYGPALYDALKYFYHNRSGIAIEPQFTAGSRTSFAPHSRWSRPAGHMGHAPNQGDVRVPCWVGTCNYTLNVAGGWYDAGDHGKYVVNGGIAVWTLLNLVERTRLRGERSLLDDGALQIPESGNGVGDLLDEVRWELEFLLSMQVPTSQPLTGMVHHKVHDVQWTALPLAPDQDPQLRALAPPSTAATLNLAAVAAQAARLWQDQDPAFARRCLESAQRAWAAAQLHPNLLYRGGFDTGGGPYDDDDVRDEFFWAAAELWLSTGQPQYLRAMDGATLTQVDLDWGHTQLAGLVSLATATAPAFAKWRAIAQRRIVTLAHRHLATQRRSGYGAPLDRTDYVWGSNSTVANRLLLVALANDIRPHRRYADGVTQGLDYLLGRNTFSRSFVTGTGTAPVRHPHHRFWAGALDANYPWAPPGALVGGPNSGLQDPLAKAQLAQCTSQPARCWLDDIAAYSVNEITINWNAPWAWLLAFQNERARVAPHRAARN